MAPYQTVIHMQNKMGVMQSQDLYPQLTWPLNNSSEQKVVKQYLPIYDGQVQEERQKERYESWGAETDGRSGRCGGQVEEEEKEEEERTRQHLPSFLP